MKHVHIWTDGSGRNAGAGGWAAVLVYNEVARVIGGYDPRTTVNRMETEAAIQGLLKLKDVCRVTLYTDSQYVLYGFLRLLKGQMLGTNIDVWERAKAALGDHHLFVQKVAGHSGDPMNDLADQYARHCWEYKSEVDEVFYDLDVLVGKSKHNGKKKRRK